jgi:hypothetical protein
MLEVFFDFQNHPSVGRQGAAKISLCGLRKSSNSLFAMRFRCLPWEKAGSYRRITSRREMLPVSKVALVGPLLVDNLACVHALTNEIDLSFEELEISAEMPGGIDYVYLLFY